MTADSGPGAPQSSQFNVGYFPSRFKGRIYTWQDASQLISSFNEGTVTVFPPTLVQALVGQKKTSCFAESLPGPDSAGIQSRIWVASSEMWVGAEAIKFPDGYSLTGIAVGVPPGPLKGSAGILEQPSSLGFAALYANWGDHRWHVSWDKGDGATVGRDFLADAPVATTDRSHSLEIHRGAVTGSLSFYVDGVLIGTIAGDDANYPGWTGNAGMAFICQTSDDEDGEASALFYNTIFQYLD